MTASISDQRFESRWERGFWWKCAEKCATDTLLSLLLVPSLMKLYLTNRYQSKKRISLSRQTCQQIIWGGGGGGRGGKSNGSMYIATKSQIASLIL